MNSKTKALKTEVSLEQAVAEDEAEGVRYTLSYKGLAAMARSGLTVQRPIADKKYGRDWRVPGVTRINTRSPVLEILDNMAPFTLEEAVSAVKESGLPLNSGTPRSYIRAFIKEGLVI